MSESINDPRLGGVVRRHMHFHSVANGKSNKTFAHFSGDVREHEIVIGKRNPKHCSGQQDRKSTRLNSSHTVISYAVFCLKKKKKKIYRQQNVILMKTSIK